MDLREHDSAVRVWVVAATLVGLFFIGIDSRIVSVTGVLLVILALMSLIAVVRNFLVGEDVG